MKLRAFLVVGLVLPALVSCGPEPGAPVIDEAQGPSTVRRGNGDDPATLDPALAEDVHTFNVLVDVYEGLLAESADGSLIPGVAESWEISEDGLVYRFQLRAAARWSNGDQVQAPNFVTAFRRVAAPESQSSYGFLLEPIENFASVADGSLSEEMLGVRVIDDQTLEVRLSSPSTHMLAVFAMPIAFPVYGDNPISAQFSDADQFIGNGAYVLADRQAGGPILLQRNEHYWDKESVAIEQIEYFPIINAATELNMYKAQELEITGTVPPGSFQSLRDQMPNELRVAPALALYYLAFDLTEAPLDNLKLRQALSMAIDRDELVQIIGRGERAAYSVVPPGVSNYVGPSYGWHDLDSIEREQRAKESYEDAGYDAANPLSVKITYDVGDIHETVALAVTSMWKDVLGVEVELEKKEWQLFLATRDDRPDWQIMRFSWFGDYNDATTFTDIFRSDSEQNLPKYTSERYDALLGQAAMESNLETRMDILTQAENLLINDYPIVPLYFYVSKHMVKPHVAGFEDNVLDRHPSKYLSIVQR